MSGSKALRGLGVTLRWEGGFVRMSGYMDEFADYSALLAEATPLRLKLDGIVALNSLGLRKWIGFIRDFGVRQLELHECPTTFVDAANMMPGIVSTNGNMQRIKSVLVPYHCFGCHNSVRVLIANHQVQDLNGAFTLPAEACPHCGEDMKLQEDPADLFFFRTYGLPG